MAVNEIEQQEITDVLVRDLREEPFHFVARQPLDGVLRSRAAAFGPASASSGSLSVATKTHFVAFPHFRYFVKGWTRHSAWLPVCRKGPLANCGVPLLVRHHVRGTCCDRDELRRRRARADASHLESAQRRLHWSNHPGARTRECGHLSAAVHARGGRVAGDRP